MSDNTRSEQTHASIPGNDSMVPLLDTSLTEHENPEATKIEIGSDVTTPGNEDTPRGQTETKTDSDIHHDSNKRDMDMNEDKHRSGSVCNDHAAKVHWSLQNEEKMKDANGVLPGEDDSYSCGSRAHSVVSEFSGKRNKQKLAAILDPNAKSLHQRSLSETLNGGNKEIRFLLNGTASDYTSLCASNGNMRHRIKMEEVVPSTSSYLDNKERAELEWQVDLDHFTSKRYENEDEIKRLPKQVRRYYKNQDELITAFENIRLEVDDVMEDAESEAHLKRMASRLAKISFVVNLLLLIAKSVAAGLSGSLAVISSVIDSVVDLVSGALMWWSNHAMKKRNIYEYPQGRTKLEPIAIMILAVVMALASVQMIRESVERIVSYAQDDAEGPLFEIPTIVICCVTIAMKLVLFIVCRKYSRNPSVQALAQDHRNDVFSNTLAVACGLIGYRVWAYADPIGAILISIYIMGSWFVTGWEQIKMLTGHTARPDFLKKITWISLNHHPEVLLIDTVRAFHFGNNFLVEVDIVLPETMTLRKSHDIGETLQLKIERLPEVERAFVHVDYETDHSPFHEHKRV